MSKVSAQPDDTFDVDSLRLPSGIAAPLTPPKPQWFGPGQKFLRGPIPWDWLSAASRLPGKALQVGLAIWHKGVTVSADGRLVVSASIDGTIRVWDLLSGLALTTFSCDGAAVCCALFGEREIIAGDAGGHVHFLRLEEPKIQTLLGKGMLTPNAYGKPRQLLVEIGTLSLAEKI